MSGDAKDISRAFSDARREGRALSTYPGQQPATLADAYAVQDLQIGQGGAGHGWKVAAIKPELRESLGASRLAGPIVRLVDARRQGGDPVEVPVVAGGFAAVEAEFAMLIARDIPLSDGHRTDEELLDAVASLHVASEVAGSPLATLSELGPTAVVSDHGNNAAVVVGPEVGGWRERALETLVSRTAVNGTVVGEGGAARLPSGGPLGSLAFLVDNLARRGMHLKAGDWVATGATTGVHRVAPGDEAVLDFGNDGTLTLRITAQGERKGARA